MNTLDKFSLWMNKNCKLSESSVYKYTRAVNSISNDMNNINVIHKGLMSMNLLELDLAICNILNNDDFIKKNTKGNNMYSNSLKQFRYFVLDTVGDYEAESEMIKFIDEKDISTTEKMQLIKSRVGQGTYRKQLLKKYDNKCIVTGINKESILIASHIKPWSACSNKEKIDIENGFILSPNMDKLFDGGLITFDRNGKMKISSFISDENRKKLYISSEVKAELRASNVLLQYLEYHRDVLFIK